MKQEFDAEKMLADAIRQIKQLRAKKPANEQTKALLKEISTPENFQKMFEKPSSIPKRRR